MIRTKYSFAVWVILEPADEWSSDFLESLGAWKEEIKRPPFEAIARQKDPFG